MLPAKLGLCSRASQWEASENVHPCVSAWCTFVCIPRCVGARLCAHAKGSERGPGWGRSSPRPPGCCWGSQPGGSQQLQAPSRCWEAQRGSSAVLQTEASLRNTNSHFRGRFAEELRAPLQSWKEASGFYREAVTSRAPPGSLGGLPPLCHTPAYATQKHCWSFLESPGEHAHMDVDPAGTEWGRVGA